MIKKITIAGLLFLNSFGCKEEDAIQVSFDKSGIGLSASETAYPSNLEGVALLLSEPAPKTLVVFIETSGDAVFGVDYTFDNPVIIPQGDSRVPIELQFFNDTVDELDETISLRIESVDDKSIEIGNQNSNDITIRDDDFSDLLINLGWGPGGSIGSDDIDLDLYLWRESSPGSNVFELVSKNAIRNNTYGAGYGFEAILLSGHEKDGLYGLSYVYYDGDSEPMPFIVSFSVSGEATVEGSPYSLAFYPEYTLNNINKGAVTIREQYFTKQGIEFKNITAVVVPESGS